MVLFTIFAVQTVGCLVRDIPVDNFSTNLNCNVQARVYPYRRDNYLRARLISDFNIGMNAVFFRLMSNGGSLSDSCLDVGVTRELKIAGNPYESRTVGPRNPGDSKPARSPLSRVSLKGCFCSRKGRGDFGNTLLRRNDENTISSALWVYQWYYSLCLATNPIIMAIILAPTNVPRPPMSAPGISSVRLKPTICARSAAASSISMTCQ